MKQTSESLNHSLSWFVQKHWFFQEGSNTSVLFDADG